MDKIVNDGAANLLSIAWDVTTTCNYDCWYCHPSLKDGKHRWPDHEAALDFFNQLAQEKLIYLDLNGGEPTLWPKLPEFLRGLDPTIEVCITTNGSRSIRWWRENIEHIDGVSLSFHSSGADVDHFVSLIREIADREDKAVHVGIINDEKKRDVIERLYNLLNESGLKISCNVRPLKNLIGSDDVESYSFDTDFISSHSFDRSIRYKNKHNTAYFNGVQFKVPELRSLKKNTFKGWTCSIGNSRLYITADGNIYRGTCRVGGKIGNLFVDTNLSLLEDVLCTRDECYCGDEITLKKYRSPQ